MPKSNFPNIIPLSPLRGTGKRFGLGAILAASLAFTLTGCGGADSDSDSDTRTKQDPPANELQVQLNGEPADFTGMAMANTYKNSALQLWNVQKAPVFEATGESPEAAVGAMIGSVMDGNQLKISLVGIDLLKQKLPYSIQGTDEGMNAMSSPRATYELTFDKKHYWGGAAMVQGVPDDWKLTIERIDGEMLHGSFQGTVVNMQDSTDRIALTEGKFALRVKGITGE